MSSGEKYLWAAYLVVLVTILAYLVIHALKLARIDRDVAEISDLARRRFG